MTTCRAKIRRAMRPATLTVNGDLLTVLDFPTYGALQASIKNYRHLTIIRNNIK